MSGGEDRGEDSAGSALSIKLLVLRSEGIMEGCIMLYWMGSINRMRGGGGGE